MISMHIYIYICKHRTGTCLDDTDIGSSTLVHAMLFGHVFCLEPSKQQLMFTGGGCIEVRKRQIPAALFGMCLLVVEWLGYASQCAACWTLPVRSWG